MSDDDEGDEMASSFFELFDNKEWSEPQDIADAKEKQKKEKADGATSLRAAVEGLALHPTKHDADLGKRTRDHNQAFDTDVPVVFTFGDLTMSLPCNSGNAISGESLTLSASAAAVPSIRPQLQGCTTAV